MIILPMRITRGFCKAHPEFAFIHGHDVQQKGFEGQASIFNEENTCPLVTMYKFCNSGARYFTDDDSMAWHLVNKSLDDLCHIKRPIIVLRKIGEGCSRMSELAPRLFAHMKRRLDDISFKDIKWDYTPHY